METKQPKNYVGKAYLVEQLAKKLNVSKSEAERIYNAMIEVQQETLLQPSIDGIQIIGFYTIEKKHNKEKLCSHPKTKEVFVAEANTSLKLKIGKNFKDELNKK